MSITLFEGLEATFTNIVESTDRLSNSESGNPRYMLWFSSHGPLKTKSDAAVNYAVEHIAEGASVQIWTNSRNEIIHLEIS